MADKDVRSFGVMELDQKNQVTDFEEKPLEPQSKIVSLGVYCISRTLLIKLLETVIAEGRYDFVKDIIARYRKKLKIFGYLYNDYWSSISSVSSYYSTNMDFLDRNIRNIFLKQRPYIETKPKDEPPAKYNIGSEARNCLVGSGSILNGYVRDSILFRRVFTGENSSVSNSIIMEGCFIGNNCVVENAILDKEVILSDGKQIIGTKDNPIILQKNSVV